MSYHKLILILLLCTQISYGQIISQFDWDADPVTAATIGPDAISVSSSAISDIGGVGGTNGLNASLPKADINFTIPGGALFDVAGIDVSVDYQRDESVANFFNRGSSLIITSGSTFGVTYRVDNGMGGFSTVSSGGVYSIPNDDVFRNYRFYYLPASGEGFLTVDGTVVWTNDGPDNRDMFWNTSDNIIIGASMDGSGSNRTFLDNLIIGSVFDSALPVSLTAFEVKIIADVARLNWTTSSELNNDKFKIEKSLNGQEWSEIGEVKGAGNSSRKINYNFKDYNPSYGQSFYRLKQIDFDGKQTVYGPKSCYYNLAEIIVYPNPTTTHLTINGLAIKNQLITIRTVNGTIVYQGVLSSQKIDLNGMANGTYYLSVDNFNTSFIIAN